MKDHYCWAQGFWYDEVERFGQEPMVDDEELDTYNAPEKL